MGPDPGGQPSPSHFSFQVSGGATHKHPGQGLWPRFRATREEAPREEAGGPQSHHT